MINGVLAAYAIIAFVGIRHSLVDIWVNVVSWLYKPQRYKPTKARKEAPQSIPDGAEGELTNWELVLYMGFADRRRSTRHIADLSEPDRTSLMLPVSAPAVADRNIVLGPPPGDQAAETSPV